MRKGFDTPAHVTKFLACLRADRYNFVCRYYNVNNQAKNLTLAEAVAISSAGLGIVAVWENGFPTSAAYFSYAKGIFDGTSAYHYAQNEIRQPGGTPIYFAVDFDATQTNIKHVISEYFQGVNDAFNNISSNQPVYNVGVYGSGMVCSAMLASNFATYSWLAQSRGWGGSKTFTGYNIKQSMQVVICKAMGGGVAGDPDESPNDNEGSFTVTLS